MSYLLQFEWPAAQRLGQELHPLAALDVEGAKLEAALTYATMEFEGEPPDAYRILQAGGEEVYRYPHAQSDAFAGGAAGAASRSQAN